MKNIYSNSYLSFSIYIILNVILDILGSIIPSIPNIVFLCFKALFLLYIFFGIILKYKSKQNFIIMGLLSIFFGIYLLSHTINITNITNIINYIFFIFVLLYISNMYVVEDKKINRNIITIAVLIYSIYIIISHYLNLNSYNDLYFKISSIITISLPFLIINLEKRINLIEVFTIGVSLIAAILIGTKLPIIIFLVCLLYLLIKKFINDAKKKKVNYTNLILFIIFVIVFIYKFNQTPVYKYMIDKAKNLNLNNPIDILTNFKLFDNFIFSGRLTNLVNTNPLMISSSITSKVVGLNKISLVNMDLFDMLYHYGLLGFILFIILITYIIKKLTNRKNINFLPIIISIITSFLAGGVVLNPNVALITVVILSNTLYKRKSKKILLAARDLRIGGIESALVTFIKNINQDNNEIVLYLEDKKGELLKELPKNIIIKQQKVFNLKLKLLQKILNTLNKLKFLMTNFKEYDFSCCYATYSLSSNFLARYASNNDSIYIHSDYTQLYKNNIDEINKFYNKRKLDKFTHIIFVSNESKDNLISIYPRLTDKSIVINNFIDNKKIIKLSEEKIKETKPRGKTLLLFVGRIDEESKNLSRLINSFNLALKENNKLMLWIIGDGKDINIVKDLIKEYKLEKDVILLGQKLNPYPYFKLCDYVILTSNYEGFPVIYGEAIVLNKPIITTINATDDAISIPNNFGYICKKDEKDIADTIINATKKDKLKYKKVNIDEINQNKYEMLKKII